MGKAKGQKRDPDSPFTWYREEGDDIPWWGALRPDWWKGSTDFLLRRQLRVFAHGIVGYGQRIVPVIQQLDNLIRYDDLTPDTVEQFEAELASQVQDGELPQVILDKLWESFSWGLTEWEVPPDLTWEHLRRNADYFFRQDIIGGDDASE